MHGARVALFGGALIKFFGPLHILADSEALFIQGREPVFRHRETLLRRLAIPLRGQFIVPLGGAAFGVTNREIELRRRIAGFGRFE